MDAVLDYLMERWPILALFVVVIIITAVVVWLLSRWYHRFEKVEDTIKESPCSKHNDLYHRIVETEEAVKELPRLRYDINEIKQELVAIRTYLTVKDTDVEPRNSHSITIHRPYSIHKCLC